MTLGEIKTLGSQIMHVYGSNSRAPKPCKLIATSFEGKLKDTLLKHSNETINTWLINQLLKII